MQSLVSLQRITDVSAQYALKKMLTFLQNASHSGDIGTVCSLCAFAHDARGVHCSPPISLESSNQRTQSTYFLWKTSSQNWHFLYIMVGGPASRGEGVRPSRLGGGKERSGRSNNHPLPRTDQSAGRLRRNGLPIQTSGIQIR